MGTTTRAVLRQRLGEATGGWLGSTSTSAGAAGGTTIVDTALQGYEDDTFLNWWAMCTSGTNSGEVRRVSSFTSSSGTVTVGTAFGAQVATSVTYELMRINPTWMNLAISRAAEELYPHLYLPIRDETLVVDNLLANPDFETFAGGAFTGWTTVGSPTLTQDTSIVWHSSGAAKIVAGGSAGQLTQAPTLTVEEIVGYSVLFKAWVYCTAADTARLRLDWDGTNFENGNYHTGADQWEHLYVQGGVPSTATQVKAICETVASGTAYFDAAWMVIYPIYKYTIPTSIRSLRYVTMQYAEDTVDAPYYRIVSPTRGHRLRLEGMGLLTRPATDAATMEIDGERVDLLTSYAAKWLMRAAAGNPHISALPRDVLLSEQGRWESEAARMLATPGYRMPRMGMEMSRGVWHTEEDASGQYIILDQPR